LPTDLGSHARRRVDGSVPRRRSCRSGATDLTEPRAPAGDPETAAPRPEARDAPPVGACLVTHVWVQALRSTSAGRTSQGANPARRGSGARAYPEAIGPPVPAPVAESVSGLAPTPDRVSDAGVENVNAQVDALIETGVLRRQLAFTELKFSNSMIEAWWRSPETSMALPSPARERRDHPPTGGLLRPGTQPRTAAFGVSRTDAGRDVRRHRRCGAGRPDVTRRRRAPSTRGGQPIGVMRDVPVPHRGRMTPGRLPFRPRASRARPP
jgi:hypothetical protein